MTIADTEAAVRACYATWSRTYFDEYYGAGAPYPPVHADLIASLLAESGAQSVLDAGCGPASFLRRLADRPTALFGFDLTPEMVQEARRVMDEIGRDRDAVWEGSVVDASAYRHPSGEPAEFDAVICVGVLPHVRPEDEAAIFRNIFGALRPGGLAIVEARNQLFSLFTMNRYSKQFVEEELIRIAQLIARAGTDAREVVQAREDMKALFRTDLPPVRTGRDDEPGYDEVLSRTHNPLLLPRMIEGAGFERARTLFYHFHCLPPMFEKRCPNLFRRESLAMENPDDWRGHFMASAFLITARKP